MPHVHAHDQTHDHSHDHAHGHTHDHSDGGHCAGHGAKADGLDAGELATCPVMPGSTVVKAEAEEDGLFRDYNGTRYYFCCDACGPMWDADPARYANA